MMYGYSTYSAYTLLNYWQHTAHGHKSERDYGVDKRDFLNIILMAWCKTVETPLLAHCSCTKSSIYGRMALWCMLSTNFMIYSYGIMCFEWIFFQNNTIQLRFRPHPWRAHACRWSKSMFCIEKNKTKQKMERDGAVMGILRSIMVSNVSQYLGNMAHILQCWIFLECGVWHHMCTYEVSALPLTPTNIPRYASRYLYWVCNVKMINFHRNWL